MKSLEKKYNKEICEENKKIQENKKFYDNIKLNQEKEDELKWIQENELMLDKQEKIRLQKYNQTGTTFNNILQNKKINQHIDNTNNKVTNIFNSKPIYVRDEESILKEIREENK